MGTLSVEAIKDAIAGLPEPERAALAAWLNAQTMDEWDREMQRDFSPGVMRSSCIRAVAGESERKSRE